MAQLRLASQIGDGAVLQQQSEVVLWGWAAPKAVVKVKCSWIRKPFSTTARADRLWEVKVKTSRAHLTATHSIEVTSAGARVTARDILFGEVWVCSGQSNMQWTLGRIGRTPKMEENADGVASEGLSVIRMHVVPHHFALRPIESIVGKWVVGSPQSAMGLSAVGWLFAKRLRRELNVPIGMIHTSWGGTPSEAWTSAEKLSQVGEFADVIGKLKVAKNRKGFNHRSASTLYNAMIHPLLRCKFKGAIWYQGESNVGRAKQYSRIFPAMIEDWRSAFDCGAFPFYFVQIAPFEYGPKRNSAALREAQLKTLSLEATGMAVTMDVGNPKNIHPINKGPVAVRLANMALGRVYGKGDSVDSGPFYRACRASGNRMILRFDNTGGKLRLSDPAKGVFQIAGADRKFVDASAVVVGDELHVHSPAVKSPKAVRYGWSNAPKAALFNRKRLPASSFRTDPWDD